LQNLWGFIIHQMQEGQFDSHEADLLMKNNFTAYREGKPMVARGLNALGFRPDWIKEEMTRQSVTALRNTLLNGKGNGAAKGEGQPAGSPETSPRS
jgi:hypothetical protein